MSENILKSLSDRIHDKFRSSDHIMTFEDFLKKVQEKPWLYVRSAAEYIVDAMDWFGTETVRGRYGPVQRFCIFNQDFDGGVDPVDGQEEAQNKLYAHIKAFSVKGRSDKLLMLHGPNATGKSSMIAALMRGMEYYSRQSEGELFTFYWLFSDRAEKGSLGFGGSEERSTTPDESLALSAPDDINFRIRSGLRDNPLTLIPMPLRREVLQDAFRKHDREISDTHPIFRMEMSQKYHNIYNELLELYQGDWQSVMNHVQVCRFEVSKRYRSSAAVIEPVDNTDASARALTLERDYDLPVKLKTVNLNEVYGDLVDGNRGLVEYSDLLKRPLHQNMYLLTTAETGTITLHSVLAYLDIVLLATANEDQIDEFQNARNYRSFKGRLEYIRMPYLLQVSKEEQIYFRIIESMSRGKHVAPHTTRFLAHWAVLTRLYKPISSHYREDEILYEIVTELTAIEKVDLYDTHEPPSRFSEEDQKYLRKAVRQVVTEFDRVASGNGFQYEGRIGASAREIKSIINEASLDETYRCINVLALVEQIMKVTRDGTNHNFVNLTQEKSYGDIETLTDIAVKRFLQWVDNDIRDSMQMVPDVQYVDLIKRYANHVTRAKRGEKIRDAAGDWVAPDEKLMKDVEDLIGDVGDRKKFRESVILRIASQSIERRNSDEKLDVGVLFQDLIERMKNRFYDDRKRNMEIVRRNILKMNTGDWKHLDADEKTEATNAFNALRDLGYCENCIKEYIVKLNDSKEG